MAPDIGGGDDPPLRHRLERLQRGDQIGQPAALSWIGEHVDQRIVALDLGMRDPAGEGYAIGGGAGAGAGPQRAVHWAAPYQQQLRPGMALPQQRQRIDEIVEPLVVVKAADEAHHGAVGELQLARQRLVARGRIAEQRQIDAIGRQTDLARLVAASDQILAQAIANGEHGIRARDHPVFQRAGQPVFERSGAPGAVADRGIFPEGAYFVDEGQAEPARGAQTGHAGERRRMGVKNIGPPAPRRAFDRVAQPLDFAPFAQARRARGFRRRAEEGQPFALFLVESLLQRAAIARIAALTGAGKPAHLHPGCDLAFHDRARAEGVAGVQRQRMVEDMQDSGHRAIPLHNRLNAPSTAIA